MAPYTGIFSSCFLWSETDDYFVAATKIILFSVINFSFITVPVPAIPGRMTWEQDLHCSVRSEIREGLEIFNLKQTKRGTRKKTVRNRTLTQT